MDYSRTSSPGDAWARAAATVWLTAQRCPVCGGEVDSLEVLGTGVLRMYCRSSHYWQDTPVAGRIREVAPGVSISDTELRRP